MKSDCFDVRWLGRIHYEKALELQERLWTERLNDEISDTLLLLEHDPVYTIGRTSDRSSLPEDPKTLPHPLIEISRGGQATYHGPGQLIGYGIFNLRNYGQDLHTYLRALEESLISLTESLGLSAQRRDGLTGVWCEDRKIASIGVGVRRWVSMHGFALNVYQDLRGFEAITPCGIQEVAMTSIAQELPDSEVTLERLAEVYPMHLQAALLPLRCAGG